jgi:hypothetical protein
MYTHRLTTSSIRISSGVGLRFTGFRGMISAQAAAVYPFNFPHPN